MSPTVYHHICAVCSLKFNSIKKIQKTCSHSCRGKYATSKNQLKTCACGNQGNTRGICPGCSIQNKRESRRRSYYSKHEENKKKKRDKWTSLTPEEKLAISRNAKEMRFNGHRGACLERDNYTCQNCGHTEDLLVHHLKHLPRHCKKDTWSTLEDLITWCRSCHIKHHRDEIRSQEK